MLIQEGNVCKELWWHQQLEKVEISAKSNKKFWREIHTLSGKKRRPIPTGAKVMLRRTLGVIHISTTLFIYFVFFIYLSFVRNTSKENFWYMSQHTRVHFVTLLTSSLTLWHYCTHTQAHTLHFYTYKPPSRPASHQSTPLLTLLTQQFWAPEE